jgi:hypothetical protein
MPSVLGLERPLFGQFVRQVRELPAEQLEACLEHQRRHGGRLKEVLRDMGLLTRDQVLQVLRLQAGWVARAMKGDLKPGALPYPCFLSVCLPAYNERRNIEDTLDEACSILPEFVQRFEVVVVDDGSRDGTGDIVARYAEADPRVRLVRHARNRGYGAAVTTGLRAADGDLVMFTDSDGQFNFLDLPQLLMRLRDHDVVIGYRFRRADSWVRLFNAWGWNWVVRLVAGVWVRDLDCAFKVFRRHVLDGLNLTATGATINAEMLVQCVRAGVKMCETPVTHWPRCSGAPTGAALKVIVRAFRELPHLWKYRFASPLLLPACSPSAPPTVSGTAPANSSVA